LREKVLIIGAGLAGLSAGLYAQINGYDSKIYEMHDVPGGLVASWRRKGYLIDGGIHFLMGHRHGTPVNDIYRELGMTGTDHYPTLTTYMRFIDEFTGTTVDIGQDLESDRKILNKMFPRDRKIIDELFDGAAAMSNSGSLYDLGLDEVPDLMGTMDKARMMWRMRRVAKLMSGRYARPMVEVAENAKEPLLRRILLGLFTPQAPEWLVMSILAMVSDGQVGLISDSCAAFISPMVDKYQDLGGRIVPRTKVEGIIVEEKAAKGVKLDDGSEHRADAVISAADGRSTIYGMLGGHFTNRRIEERYRKWDPGYSVVTVSLGITRTFPDEPPLRTVLLREPLASFGHPVDQVTIRTLNYGEVFAPPGKTLVQLSFDGDWEFWSELSKDRIAYEGRKKMAAREMILILERRYPTVFSYIDMVDVSTPHTYQRYTGNHHGSIMGWAPPSKELLKPIPRTLPGLKDFYLAGQWSLPGGSVPTCLGSGRQAVQMMCHEDGRVFVSRRSNGKVSQDDEALAT
jgi:phytoene desaturase